MSTGPLSHTSTYPSPSFTNDNFDDQPICTNNKKPTNSVRTCHYGRVISPLDAVYTTSVQNLPPNVRRIFYNAYFLIKKFYPDINGKLISSLVGDVISTIIKNKNTYKRIISRKTLIAGVIVAYLTITMKMKKYVPITQLVSTELGEEYMLDHKGRKEIISEFFKLAKLINSKTTWRDTVKFYINMIVFENNLPFEIYNKAVEVLNNTPVPKGRPSLYAVATIYCVSKKLGINIDLNNIIMTVTNSRNITGKRIAIMKNLKYVEKICASNDI